MGVQVHAPILYSMSVQVLALQRGLFINDHPALNIHSPSNILCYFLNAVRSSYLLNWFIICLLPYERKFCERKDLMGLVYTHTPSS
jgi:hypothetical protein